MKIVVLLLSMTLCSYAMGYDSDEPFAEGEDNPIESLRRVARLMNRLAKDTVKEKELENLHRVIEERLTRALLSMENEASQNSSSQNSSGSKFSHRQSLSSGVQPQKQRQSSMMENSLNDDFSKRGEGFDDKMKKPDKLHKKNSISKKEYKKKSNYDSKQWGHLPPKIRERLKTNLGRDVPEEIEEDMKDFSMRVNELK